MALRAVPGSMWVNLFFPVWPFFFSHSSIFDRKEDSDSLPAKLFWLMTDLVACSVSVCLILELWNNLANGNKNFQIIWCWHRPHLLQTHLILFVVNTAKYLVYESDLRKQICTVRYFWFFDFLVFVRMIGTMMVQEKRGVGRCAATEFNLRRKYVHYWSWLPSASSN